MILFRFPSRIPFQSHRSRWLGVLIPLGFFVVGIFTLYDYGATVDEWETLWGARAYANIFLSFFSGKGAYLWPFHALPGYYFVIDLYRYGVARLFVGLVSGAGFTQGFHFANLVLSSLSLFLIYRISILISKSARTAVLSTLALAIMPQFIAHSQSNPKDLVALFGFTLGIFSVLNFQMTCTKRAFAFGCIGLGLAWTSTPFSILVVPLLAVWIFLFDQTHAKLWWKEYVLLLIGGSVMAFFFWPWLWSHPFWKLKSLISQVSYFSFNIGEIYLGVIYKVHQLPWHYVSSHLLASVPVLFLIGFLLNLYWGIKRKTAPSEMIATVALALLWFGAGLAMSFQSELKYNGMRHFLFVMPALSLLIGTGFEVLFNFFKARIAFILIFSIYGYGVLQMVSMHPYEGAYLNEIVNWALPGPAENYFSVEYFGQPYLEGSRWLSSHAEPESEIIVPIHRHVANIHLVKRSVSGSIERFKDTSQLRYLMYVVRRSQRTEQLQSIEKDYVPVFEIRRQKATLLRIFKNTLRRPPTSIHEPDRKIPVYGQ